MEVLSTSKSHLMQGTTYKGVVQAHAMHTHSRDVQPSGTTMTKTT